MSTSSSSRSSPAPETESRLRAFVLDQYDSLLHGRAESIRTDLQCRLVQRDRNLVYRISGAGTWYLKIPTKGVGSLIERELAGYQTLASRYEPAWGLPISCLGELSPPFLLSSAIPGRSLNHTLYRASFVPLLFSRDAAGSFASLGHVLGLMHSAPVSPDLPEADRSLKRLPLDALDDGERDIHRKAAEAASPVHGNLALRNIRVHERHVGLIDFESFGRGCIYDDISVVVAQLLLMRTSRLVRRGPIARCTTAYLDAYATHRVFDLEVLAGAVALQIRGFKARARKHRREAVKVAGVPISDARIDALNAALRASPQTLF